MKIRRFLFVMMMGLCWPGLAPVFAEDKLAPEILEAIRVVEDPEGSVNVRSGPSVKSNVTGQMPSGAVVAIEPGPVQDWAKLWTAAEGDAARYIHSSRLKPVMKWRQVAAKLTKDGKAASVQADGLLATVKAIPFVAKDHRISKDKDGLELVDGESPWGMDGGLPKQSLTLTVSLNGKPIALPKEAMKNLYQPNVESLVLLTLDKASSQALLLMTNGDGAGGYCIAWSFRNGIYTGREIFVPF